MEKITNRAEFVRRNEVSLSVRSDRIAHSPVVLTILWRFLFEFVCLCAFWCCYGFSTDNSKPLLHSSLQRNNSLTRFLLHLISTEIFAECLRNLNRDASQTIFFFRV